MFQASHSSRPFFFSPFSVSGHTPEIYRRKWPQNSGWFFLIALRREQGKGKRLALYSSMQIGRKESSQCAGVLLMLRGFACSLASLSCAAATDKPHDGPLLEQCIMEPLLVSSVTLFCPFSYSLIYQVNRGSTITKLKRR